MVNQIPDDIRNNPQLDAAISVVSDAGDRRMWYRYVRAFDIPMLAPPLQLPANYNFEIRKTIWKLRQAGSKKVALQFPEGLLMFACVIADIVKQFTGADTVVMGDVTYGACCVDDLSAKALGCDFMVHYGHSCLVPVSNTSIKMLYVFVEITFDTTHVSARLSLLWTAHTSIAHLPCSQLVQLIKDSFDHSKPLAVLGTIQFAAAIHRVRSELTGTFPRLLVPQSKPLSPGEVLGCTSPRLPKDIPHYVFVSDGRFHLESALIHNPTKAAFRYNPYDKTMTAESYDHEAMRTVRKAAIDAAVGADTVGLILGTLGRQGNPAILRRLKTRLRAAGKRVVTVLMSEIFPQKLALFPQVQAWVQVACPRLSVDWGEAFTVPLLNPYEANVALDTAEWAPVYPMDYYAAGSGPWTNYYKEPQPDVTPDGSATSKACCGRGPEPDCACRGGSPPPAAAATD